MLRLFLFPHSDYLTNRWWHRLAKVLMVIWAVVVVGYVYNVFYAEPYSRCVYLKGVYDAHDLGIRLDCNGSAMGYMLAKLDTSRGLADLVFVLIGTYIALCLPGLLYRVILYIAKGKAWRTAEA